MRLGYMFDASVLGGIWQDRAGINQPHVQADDLMISSGRRQFAFGGPELTDCMMIFAFIWQNCSAKQTNHPMVQ